MTCSAASSILIFDWYCVRAPNKSDALYRCGRQVSETWDQVRQDTRGLKLPLL